MAGQGNSFPQNYSTDDSYESSLFHTSTLEDKEKGYLYPINNEVVNDLRRITMSM